MVSMNRSIKQQEQLDGYQESERLEKIRQGWINGYVEEFERRDDLERHRDKDKHIRGYD